jgi:hypothetical protein
MEKSITQSVGRNQSSALLDGIGAVHIGRKLLSARFSMILVEHCRGGGEGAAAGCQQQR